MLPPLPVPAVTERRVRQCGGLSHYKPKWMRLLAVAAAMTCIGGGLVNYTKAGQVFEVKIGYFKSVFPKEPAQLGEASSQFVKRWYENFVKTGNVDDAPRSGRPPKIPDSSARQAAELISRGYTVQHNVRGQQVQEHKYFSSVAEAVTYHDVLRDMLTEFKATNEQLISAMHRAAPELVRRRVTFRHKLSNDEKAKRQRVAAELLARYQTDTALIERMVFIDETTIMTHSLKHDHIEVWVNQSDTKFHDYHGVPGKAWDPVKVHVVAAVTAHPSYERTGGLVYVEFTTGTTDIRRRINKRLDGSTRSTDFVYLVSGLLLAQQYYAGWAG